MAAGASPANSEELAVIQQGVKAWNEWRKNKNPDFSPNLAGADLRHRDLTGADFRKTYLSNANLEGVTLGPGTLLRDAKLCDADLYRANLRGADLQNVNFSDANLVETNLHETNLQGADLRTVKGALRSRQLAGADLINAKLPDPLSKLYESLSSVKEISDSAQKLFLALLAGCLYSWLTIAQTTDVELITNRATTPLPIIQAAIPIVGFYVVAPLILLCIYFYFHFYLQKLWEELGSLPAVFTDGRELHKRTDPWLLNDLVRSHFVKLKDGRPFLSYFQAWVSVVLAWWLVPVTLFAFWLRFIRRHDLFWTSVHVSLLALAIYSAVRLYSIAQGTLRGEERDVFRWKEVWKRRRNYWRLGLATGLGALIIAISIGAIFGRPCVNAGCSGFDLQMKSPSTWVPWVLNRAGYHPFVLLGDADVSIKPSNWDEKEEKLGSIKGADLSGRDLRYAQAWGASFVKAKLEGAFLEHVQFDLCDLREGYLESAHLADASLKFSTLDNAILITTDLRNADLQNASLQNAHLNAADLTGAKLKDARLKYASFLNFPGIGNTHGLTRQMVLSAHDWQLAFYDPDMLKQLGLPPDHNEKLQKQMDAELKQAKSAVTTPPIPK